MKFDFLLAGGLIVDGTPPTAGPKTSDIGIKGDRIEAIGHLSKSDAEMVIDVKGLCISPGFIDCHCHSEFTALADPRAAAKVTQGVTTEINGNCGLSSTPLSGDALEQRAGDFKELGIKERWGSLTEYFEILSKKKIAINFMTLTGHGNLRASVIGYVDAVPTSSDMRKMKTLLKESLSQGSVGLSTGLIYPPGVYAKTDEIVELAMEAASSGGIYTTHLRSEGDKLLEAVDEAIKIGMDSGVHVHLSHLKTSRENNWSKLEKVFEQIEKAHQMGIKLTCDRYPYIAASTDLDSVLPEWAYEGGRDKELWRLKYKREELKKAILDLHPERSYWEKIKISSVALKKNKWMEGKSLSDIGEAMKKHPVDCVFDILLEEELRVGAIFFTMNEDNLRAILRKDYAMIGSDSSGRSFDGVTAKGKPHPRGFGTFPRILGKYVREDAVLSIEDAIYKMTGLPAKVFKIKERGILTGGYFADIVVFDPEKIKDTATFEEPFQRPLGIYYVFVNGIPALWEGEPTDAMAGRVLKRAS
ncbi:MAG: D-aminoacylase [Nitrospirae bacterium]|nr:D-aminoacylase [Nitrospirota bacterium]